MLVEIKPGTNVPTDKEVLAVGENEHVTTGFLEYYPKQKQWVCVNQETDMPLMEVTHFVTIENLLKTR